MGVQFQYQHVAIIGTDVQYRMGEMRVEKRPDGSMKPSWVVGLGVNPLTQVHVTVVIEFGRTKEAKLGDEDNFKRIWMCSPIAVVVEVTMEEKAEIVTPAPPRLFVAKNAATMGPDLGGQAG